MRDNLDVARCKALVKCGFMMVSATRVNSAMTYHGEKEECLERRVRFKMGIGKRAILSHSFDSLRIYLSNLA